MDSKIEILSRRELAALVECQESSSVWNYYELTRLVPKNKYDIIKGHVDFDAETERVKIERRESREAYRLCAGEGSCHGSLGDCSICGDTDSCDVVWPYRCDVHEKYPEKPPVEKPPVPNRSQLFLPGLNPRSVVVKIFPQPYWDRSYFNSPAWLWQYDPSAQVVARDPTKSKTMLQNCPYEIGQKVGPYEAVESIEVVRGNCDGAWYWKLNFPHLVCEDCGCDDDSVEVVGAMTAYHWDGKGEDPNRNPRLCPSCAEDYISYWDERWKEYYSGLL